VKLGPAGFPTWLLPSRAPDAARARIRTVTSDGYFHVSVAAMPLIACREAPQRMRILRTLEEMSIVQPAMTARQICERLGDWDLHLVSSHLYLLEKKKLIERSGERWKYAYSLNDASRALLGQEPPKP